MLLMVSLLNVGTNHNRNSDLAKLLLAVASGLTPAGANKPGGLLHTLRWSQPALKPV